MTNLLERAIGTDDADRAAKIIQNALGIESDEVANYCASQNLAKGLEATSEIIGEASS
jgi:hypothetical protein